MGGAIANNVINAATAAGNLTGASVAKAMNFGQPTPQQKELRKKIAILVGD